MTWILNFSKQGKFDALNEQTSCLTKNDHGSNFLSNMLASCCQRMLFHFWYFSISLLLLQNQCRWLSGLSSFNWQTYLSSAGLDEVFLIQRLLLWKTAAAPGNLSTLASKDLSATPLTARSAKYLPISCSLGSFLCT